MADNGGSAAGAADDELWWEELDAQTLLELEGEVGSFASDSPRSLDYPEEEASADGASDEDW